MTVIVFYAQYTIKMCLPSNTSVQQLRLKLHTLTEILPRNQRLFYQDILITSAHNLADFKCAIMTLALVKGPVLGGGKETEYQFSPEALTEWLCRNYQETNKSCYISKDNLFKEAIDYFKLPETTSNKRLFFEILGRHIFGKIPTFMTINLKSKKQIRGLQKRGVLQTSDSTAAQSARNRSVEETVSENNEELKIDTGKEQTGGNIEQNTTEMTYDMKNGSKKDGKESNINDRTASEDDVTINTEKEQTDGDIEQNATEMRYDMKDGSREDEKESNINDGTVSEEDETIDTEKEQTGGTIERQNATEIKYEMNDGSREDGKERNINKGTVSEDIEDVTIDTGKEQTGGTIEQNATEIKYEMNDGSREDGKERNIKKGTVSKDIKDVTIDTKKEQTVEDIEQNATEMRTEMRYDMKDGSSEDKKESNINDRTVSEDIEDLMIDPDKEQTGGNREQTATEMKYDMKDGSREDGKESNINDGTASEDDVTINTEKEQTDGDIDQNATEMRYDMKDGSKDDGKESNINDGTTSEDIEDVTDVTIDTEKEQTCGNIEQTTTEMKYDMKDGSREDEKESNINDATASEDIEDLMIDTEKEQARWDMNATEMKYDGRDSDDADEADKVALKHPCTIASAGDMFCNKVLLSSRQWNNANVKDLKPQELDCLNFKQYLSFSVPKPLPRVNSEKRMVIYQSSAYSTSHSNNCLRAFLIKAFPPVQVCNAAAKDFSSLTFPSDVLPQFTGTCHSSIRNRTRFSIKCVACPLYQDRCIRQGVFSKLSSCGDKDLDGISQAIIHHKLHLHQSALAYFSGSSATVAPVEAKFSSRDVQKMHQKTIFQALKLNEPNTKVTHCLGFFENQEIVESYKDSSGIRRMTAKTLFERERSKGKFQCFHKVGHEKCLTWAGWKERHTEEAEKLTERRTSRAAYVTVNKKVHYDGKSIQVNVAIKSLDPPCSGKPSGNINHPFTCDNCYKLQHYLLDLHKKRSQAKLKQEGEGRVGKRGFRLDYATQTEVKEKLHSVTKEKKNLEKTVVMRKQQRDVLSWEEMLHNSCKHGYQEKLIVDLLALFREDIDIKKPVQVTVLTNLVGKLKGNVNHKYIPLIKMIAKLHKTRLGETNYDLMSSVFGLPCSTTCDNYMLKEKLQPGFNLHVIKQASHLYNGAPVIEASDEARALRFLQAVQNEDGDVTLIGKCWNADVDKWDSDVIRIPKKDESKGDEDDFAALKRMVDGIIASTQLASKVSIHNLCNLAGQKSQPLVYLMWPTPNKGYSGSHLLKIWRKVRQNCAANNVNLIGHSVDSAGFSLSASVLLMTPTESAAAEGIKYLGLGVPDEKFVAPYFWKLPSIAYGDYDHLKRTFLRVLKYNTRNLTFYKDSRGSAVATINHLHELMHICKEKGQSVPFSANDLLLISFFDQRPDTANRIFTLKVADMLHKYVKGSEGTCLYVTAVYFLTEPFFNANYGSPEEIQKALSTGITVLRLWKRYLELKKMKLHSQTNAAKIKERRGNFITYGAYTTSELLFSAGSQHSLAMFLHFKHLGPEVCSPHRSGTITTEKIIGQLQGKTNQLQSLDTSPTYADMINKTKDLAFITEALSELSSYEGIRIPATSNRKLSHFQVRKGNDTPYQYPCTYKEFLERQRDMHRAGVGQAQGFVRKYLPDEFETTLTVNGCWELPYRFTKPAETVIVSEQPPSYDKLEVCLDLNTPNSVENEVAMENLLAESEEDEFVRQPSQLDEVDDDQEMTVAKTDKLESDDDDGQDSETSSEGKSKWYIDKNGSPIHIKKALKLLIPREFISKERSRRHWVTNSLHTSLKPIDPSHNVIQFRDVAVADKDNYFILHILSIISEDGKELVSTSSKYTHTVRGIIYRDVESNQYGFVSTVFVSRWLPVSKVLMEVVLESDSDGIAKLSEQSQLDLETVLANDDNCSEAGIDEIAECADENKFYEVEKIIDVRLNKQYHSEEYKVRFKGYGPEDDMWIPSSSFREPVQFQTVSKKGRVRKHKTKDEGEVEIQQRKRLKQSNVITANTAKTESDERMKKDVPARKVSLPKKQTKSSHNKTDSKKRQIFDLESEGEVVSLQLENDDVTTRPHKEKTSSGIKKRKKKIPSTKICKRKKATKKDGGRNFRKSLPNQPLPESNSSGSDLEESQFSDTVIPKKRTLFTPQSKRASKRKTPSEKPDQSKIRMSRRLNNEFGLSSGSELDESVNNIVVKRKLSAGDDRGDDIEPSTTYSSRGSWADDRKRDGVPFQVCRGTFHQSWHEDFQCPGKQCSSIALTSLLYTTVKPIESWKASDLDQVLLTGDKVHFNQLCYIGKSASGELKLALDELPKDLQCFRFQFFTQREILGGTIDKRDTTSDDDDFPRLEEMFEKCQKEKAIGLLLRILDYTVACAQSYTTWYVIDSHARNSIGMVDDKGSSVVLKFDNFNALSHYIRSFVEAATSERELSIDDLTFEALVLNIKERKSAESEDVLILPVSTLSSYQTSFGSIDVHSCFTACLEKDQEVNDDVLDFYLLHAAENQLHCDLKKILYLYNSCFYKKLSQFNPQAIMKWTKNTDIFSKKYLVIPVCDGHHWILVIVRTVPNISLMILDSLHKQQKPVERRITRYLRDVWSARTPQGGKKTLEVEQIRYPTVPQQPNDKDCGLYVMKCFEQFLDFVNRDLQWSSWNPAFSHQDILSLRKKVKHTIMDEISTE